MKLTDLVNALLQADAVQVRALLQEGMREGIRWDQVSRPELSGDALAVAAGVVELMSRRSGASPPRWTEDVEPAHEDVFLVRAALTMPRLRRMCMEEGPEPLRRRRIFAPPDFLTVA